MFNITSGNILVGVLYVVYGAQSVVYNGSTYTTGQKFRGVAGVSTFTFSGTGTQLVYEVEEFSGGSVELSENGLELPVFTDSALFNGFGIEYAQNASDISFTDVTQITGFAMELIDYPFYSFEIAEEID
jgi:hypothetical protein